MSMHQSGRSIKGACCHKDAKIALLLTFERKGSWGAKSCKSPNSLLEFRGCEDSCQQCYFATSCNHQHMPLYHYLFSELHSSLFQTWTASFYSSPFRPAMLHPPPPAQ